MRENEQEKFGNTLKEMGDKENYQDISSAPSIKRGILRILKLKDTSIEENNLSFILRRIREDIEVFFVGNKKLEFERLLDVFASNEYADDKSLAQDIAEKLHEFIARNYTLEEFEKRAREVISQTQNRINEILTYTTHEQDLALHVMPSSTFLLKDKRLFTEEGLKRVAELLKSEQNLQTISTISATSWIVTKHPKFMESLGFHIDKKVDEENTHCSMSREEFLRRYG